MPSHAISPRRTSGSSRPIPLSTLI
jgi:hypothetical protein